MPWPGWLSRSDVLHELMLRSAQRAQRWSPFGGVTSRERILEALNPNPGVMAGVNAAIAHGTLAL